MKILRVALRNSASGICGICSKTASRDACATNHKQGRPAPPTASRDDCATDVSHGFIQRVGRDRRSAPTNDLAEVFTPRRGVATPYVANEGRARLGASCAFSWLVCVAVGNRSHTVNCDTPRRGVATPSPHTQEQKDTEANSRAGRPRHYFRLAGRLALPLSSAATTGYMLMGIRARRGGRGSSGRGGRGRRRYRYSWCGPRRRRER